MIEVNVTVKDVRNTQIFYCGSGLHAWFKRNNLDFVKFLDSGISSTELEATGDAMALRAVEIARDRVLKEQNNGG